MTVSPTKSKARSVNLDSDSLRTAKERGTLLTAARGATTTDATRAGKFAKTALGLLPELTSLAKLARKATVKV